MDSLYRTSLCLLLSLLIFRVGASETEDPIKATLQATLDNYGELDHFTGLQFSYLPHGTDESITSTVGYTSKEKTQPVTAETLFGWGSITKEFTSAVLISLEAEGKISLTDTLFEKLPEYFAKHSWPDMWKDVTIYQLLNMSSGIPDYVGVLFYGVIEGKYPSLVDVIETPWTLLELVDLASNFQHTQLSVCQEYHYCFETGTSWRYSNTDYILAGILIEELSGDSVLNRVNSLVFPHLPSNGVGYYEGGVASKAVLDRMAQGYGTTTVSGPQVMADGTQWPYYMEGPAGGMVGNSAGLVTLVKALYGGKIVGETLTKQFLYDYFVNTTTGQPVKDLETECNPHQRCYGLGIMYQHSDTYGGIYFYDGRPLAYISYYAYLPCYDLALGVSRNSADIDSLVLMDVLFDQMENIKKMNPEAYQTEVNPSFCPKANPKSDFGFLRDNVQV
eukprot:CAMPEP_0115008854 /NCGR_PEP_ID=MMETSP0216-20121206/22203_1 /TAXON_ID=223996 /ORGANISM="Protocruzia adherens, Strain Boccale" /LENGTH=446 /DNA_ID=CAMNT_0002376427 /DNA_START=69 /DNA_END=1409 /DNA_ORIENTATION=+